jgi:predicted metal-dependent HD superfamily phosphohydrolase
VDDLRNRWPLLGADELRDRLLGAYADPRRGYHDARHLTEVLDRVDDLAGELGDELGGEAAARDAVVLAAWFHDAVYEGGADDEERSAALAEGELPAVGAPAATVAEVARLVRLTAAHRPTEDDRNGQVLSDADLAILAAEPDRYSEYVTGVRREYAHVEEAAFRAGRAAVLRDLLAKPALFHTPTARTRWEDAARRNVQRELAALEAPR